MPKHCVDVIDWDGQGFCVLADPFWLRWRTDFDRTTESITVALDAAYDTSGRIVPSELLPPGLALHAKAMVIDSWETWELSNKRKLLREPACRIYTDETVDEPESRATVEQIRTRIGQDIDRRRKSTSHE